MKDLKATYTEFVTYCNDIANDIKRETEFPCEFEGKLYEDYDWFCGTFMTDKFGGNAVIVKFYDNKWFYNENQMANMYELSDYILEDVENTYNSRNQQELSDFINSQY